VSKQAVHENATTKVRLELVKHEGGQLASARLQICQECRPVLLYRPVQQSRFGTMAFIRDRTRDGAGVTACFWLRGKHQKDMSATGSQMLRGSASNSYIWAYARRNPKGNGCADHGVPMQFRPEIPTPFAGIRILRGSFSALLGAHAP
jgi:hypothetical protein